MIEEINEGSMSKGGLLSTMAAMSTRVEEGLGTPRGGEGDAPINGGDNYEKGEGVVEIKTMPGREEEDPFLFEQGGGCIRRSGRQRQCGCRRNVGWWNNTFDDGDVDKLILAANGTGVLSWYVDASFAVHPDMKGHTGGTMTMGTGFP